MFKHDIRMYGTSGLYIPILPNNTSARMTMSLHQKAQVPPIKSPEEAVVDTGYALQMAKFSYDIVVENDSFFIKAIKRFGIKTEAVDSDDWMSIILVMYDTVEDKLVHYEVKNYRLFSNKFGVKYNVNIDYINSLELKDSIPAGTKLAVSNGNSEGVHKTGVNLNTVNCTLPEVGEDCILLSSKVLDKFEINIYDQYEVSYGKEFILANARGDLENYKSFPDKGDWIEAGEVLFSKIPLDLRMLKKGDYTYITKAMQYTDVGLMSRRPHFSDHTIMRYSGRVVDVEIHYNSKTGDAVENEESTVQATDYLMSLRTYHSEILEMYRYYQRNFPNGDIDDDTNKLIVDAMLFLETPIRGKNTTVSRKRKRTKLDMYTVKIITECPIKPNTGFKFASRYANKGVIKIVPYEDMPRDSNGTIADCAILAKGISGRTNLGLPAEQYIGSSSRQMKASIIEMLKVRNSAEIGTLPEFEINTVYDYLLEYLSHFNTIQYKIYSGKYTGTGFTENAELYVNRIITLEERIEILKEIYDRELYIVYNINEKETIFDITNRLESSKFKLKPVDVYIKGIDGEFKKMKSRAFISPLYTVMLDKITDSFLGADSFFLNGYGLPTGKSKDDGRYAWKYKCVKQWGESEYRLLYGHSTPRLGQILRDRSNSIKNHELFITNQLISQGVTSKSLIPNRVEDDDVAINIFKAVLEPAGITIGSE